MCKPDISPYQDYDDEFIPTDGVGDAEEQGPNPNHPERREAEKDA